MTLIAVSFVLIGAPTSAHPARATSPSPATAAPSVHHAIVTASSRPHAAARAVTRAQARAVVAKRAVTAKPAPTTTTVRAPAVAPVLASAQVRTPAPPVRVVAAAAVTQSGYGCAAAVSYLAGHAAPGFQFQCPGNSLGHQAMTCINVAGVCSGERLIAITVPCRAAYMNEASNSWVLLGLRQAPIDPYGSCG